MTRLNYEEFRQFCLKTLVSVLDKELYDATFAQIQKTDEDIHDSIQFIEKGMKTGTIPSFRIKPFYLDYCAGQSLGEVMQRILRAIEDAGSITFDFDLNDFEQFDTTKDTLIIRPVNYLQNKKILENHLYKRVGDIALTLYNVMKADVSTFSTAKVPKKTALSWHLDVEYLLNYAMENTALLYPPYIVPIERTFGGHNAVINTPGHNRFFMNPLVRFEFQPSLMNVYYLSIEGGINGAVAAFYYGVLEKLCAIMDDDLYLTFTSVREAMIHPASLFSVDMVKKAAQSSMDAFMDGENEHLSQRAYMFFRSDKTLKIV